MMFEREKKTTKHIHEGKYAANVAVMLRYDDSPWSPTISAPDIQKLDRVRLALRRGDIAAAKRDAEVFELFPVA